MYSEWHFISLAIRIFSGVVDLVVGIRRGDRFFGRERFFRRYLKRYLLFRRYRLWRLPVPQIMAGLLSGGSQYI